MKLSYETSISDFKAWSGAIDTKQAIIENDKEEDFDAIMEDLYPYGLDETDYNDILWFESDWIYECLGISDDKEEIDNDDESEDE